jgi:hypothetical protein
MTSIKRNEKKKQQQQQQWIAEMVKNLLGYVSAAASHSVTLVHKASYLVRPTASTSYDIVDAATSFVTYGRLCKEALS